MAWAAAAAAAAAIVGGALSNVANKKEASKNREFQERMSSTAYQRAMADMQKAGLNPMLAYSQGPASSPSGSTARMGDFGGAAAGNIIAQEKVRSSTAKQQSQQAETQKAVTERTKMETEDYKLAGNSIAGRQFITAKRIGESTGRYLQNRLDKARGPLPTKKSWSFDQKMREAARKKGPRKQTPEWGTFLRKQKQTPAVKRALQRHNNRRPR